MQQKSDRRESRKRRQLLLLSQLLEEKNSRRNERTSRLSKPRQRWGSPLYFSRVVHLLCSRQSRPSSSQPASSCLSIGPGISRLSICQFPLNISREQQQEASGCLCVPQRLKKDCPPLPATEELPELSAAVSLLLRRKRLRTKRASSASHLLATG